MTPPASSAPSSPFAAQTAMREHLRAGLRHGAMALVDVGTTKISALVVSVDPSLTPSGSWDPGAPLSLDAIRAVGAGQQRSRGVRRGAIVDMEACAKAVRAAVTQAERDSGLRVFQAVGALGSGYPRSLQLSATVPLEQSRVEAGDVRRAYAACWTPKVQDPHPFGEGRVPLHGAAVNWTVDGEGHLLDPVGVAGKRLSVDLHLLTVADTAAQNLAHCLSRADLDCAGIAATGYVSGLACLRAEEMAEGVACLDMGGGVTALSLFLKNRLVFADAVRLGGEDVTLDIVRGLGLPQAEAERSKTLEGSAVATEGAAKERLSLGPDAPHFDRGVAPTRSNLTEMIQPRVDEILEMARDRLEQAGFGYLPNRRLVLTGGAAELTGMLDRAQAVFGRPARLARPIRLGGLPPTGAGPSGSAAAGLASHVNAPMDQLWDHGGVKKADQPGRLGGLWKWVIETW